MNTKPLLLLFALFTSLSLEPLAQTADASLDVRKAFLITRPKVAAKPAPKARAKPRQRTENATAPLGLGYTLYQRDRSGQPVRVDAAQEFHAGDAVRLLLEFNVEGYLYVFHAENGNAPTMIFPDARLNGGDNWISAHVPYEVPSSRETDPRFRWFYFDDKAATERLSIIVTRNPLPNVPAGKVLVANCSSGSPNCAWRPTEAVWNRWAAPTEMLAAVSSRETFGQALTALERDAVTRGLGLPSGAPAPAVVKMSSSTKAERLMLTIDLVHK